MTRGRGARVLAWTLGISGALGCAFTLALTAGLGLFSAHALTYLTFIAAGLLGAVVAYREPRNGVGWLMCAASLAATLLYLPLDYGYAALVIEHGSWPLGDAALWLGTWTWAPIICLFFPLLTVRFPDGILPTRWRTVDWLAVIGTATAAAGVALAPKDVQVNFLAVPQTQLPVIASSWRNPLGGSLSAGSSSLVIYAGLVLVLLAYIASVASAIDRYRRARGDQRLQLKWFAYAGVLLVTAFLVEGAAVAIGVVPSADIEVVFHLSFFALPLAIAIAILRYHLYDIDLIINRSLVYGGMTAILGAVYAAVVTLLNRLFIAASGQKSDAAYVVTAFVVVVASSPVKDWLQRQVDRRIAHRSPSAVLDELTADVDAVVSVIDVHRIARRLLEDAVSAFDARGAALYLHPSNETPLYSLGRLNGEAIVEVALRYEDQHLGRLVLGSRRGDITYSQHDVAALQRSADSIAEALALAAHLGFRPLPRSRGQRETAMGGTRQDE